MPKYCVTNVSWFNRPGIASVLIPRAGSVQECRTSSADTSSRTSEFAGVIIR